LSSFVQIEAADRRLLNVISDAMAEAARRSGAWLVCRPGCTQCCIGPFAITALDAIRLRRGLVELDVEDPPRAQAIRRRAAEYVRATSSIYPGDPVTGKLFDEDALPDAMDELPCPALDPATGRCDLYSSRPITCRIFGPVTRVENGAFAACELCYSGASEEEMAACAIEVDPEGLEGEVLAALDREGASGATIVAYALASGLPISQ
jgi:Fe-S-cluster containining protein